MRCNDPKITKFCHFWYSSFTCAEDRATLESDLSADIGGYTSGQGLGLLPASFPAQMEARKAINSGGSGAEPLRLSTGYPYKTAKSRISLKITPSMAHRILEHCNANNRPIPEARVMRITQQIKNNQWIINTNTIGFNVNGNLCDGQKRLTAILRANKAITTLVIFNPPVDSFKTVDTNQARNASDLAAMAGISDYGHVGTAINLLYRYQQGTLQRFGENPDNIIRDQLIKENLAIQDSIGAGRSVAKMMSKSVGVFCHYVLACIDREAANRFFEKLGTGAFLFPDDPIFLLRERLTRERMARTYFPAYEIVALIFKAWNACRTKKKTKALRWSPKGGESYPRPI